MHYRERNPAAAKALGENLLDAALSFDPADNSPAL
jgi:hypothetical protein